MLSVSAFGDLQMFSVFLGVREGFWVLESVFGCFRVLKCFSVLVSVLGFLGVGECLWVLESVFGCWRVFLGVLEC